VRVTHCLGHHEVDPPAEDPLKVFLEAKIGVEWIRCTRGEVDEDVNIIVLGPEMVAGCRAEQSKAPHVVRATGTSDRFTVQNSAGTHEGDSTDGYWSCVPSVGPAAVSTCVARLWNFTVLGEASAPLSAQIKEQFANVTWRQPARLRNRIVEG